MSNILAADLLQSFQSIRSMADLDAPLFSVSPVTYMRLQWLNHCRRAYPIAPRKIRKCAERSIAKRRKQVRGRYE